MVENNRIKQFSGAVEVAEFVVYVQKQETFLRKLWESCHSYSSHSPTSKHFSNSGSGSKQSEQNPCRKAWRSLCYLRAPQGMTWCSAAPSPLLHHCMWYVLPLEQWTFSSFRSRYAIRRSCRYSKASQTQAAFQVRSV